VRQGNGDPAATPGPRQSTAVVPNEVNGSVADHGDVAATYDADPWPALADASAREVAILRELWRCTAPESDIAQVKHATLAARVGLKPEAGTDPGRHGSRQVRRLLASLVRRGLVVPIRQTAPMPGGGRRQVTNRYRLLIPAHALPSPQANGISPGRTARKWSEVPLSLVAPPGHDQRCPSSNVSTEVSLEREGSTATTGETVSNPTAADLAELSAILGSLEAAYGYVDGLARFGPWQAAS
jgi:hypothetical protein